jgi:PAS domain-containing protein
VSVRRDCRNKPRRQGSPGPSKVRPARTAVPSKRVVSSSDARALKQARAQADAAIAKSNVADARLRDAIDILPQGVVFLDPEERYILWNKQYAEIYRGSADQFRIGRKLEDTLRVGVARQLPRRDRT